MEEVAASVETATAVVFAQQRRETAGWKHTKQTLLPQRLVMASAASRGDSAMCRPLGRPRANRLRN